MSAAVPQFRRRHVRRPDGLVLWRACHHSDRIAAAALRGAIVDLIYSIAVSSFLTEDALGFLTKDEPGFLSLGGYTGGVGRQSSTTRVFPGCQVTEPAFR